MLLKLQMQRSSMSSTPGIATFVEQQLQRSEAFFLNEALSLVLLQENGEG